MEYEEIVQQIIEFLGTFAFAISGIRHAAAKHFDWFGGYVCGIAVAIGGGTIRDVMLGTTPFWMTNPIYIICTALALVFVIIFAKHMEGLRHAYKKIGKVIKEKTNTKLIVESVKNIILNNDN